MGTTTSKAPNPRITDKNDPRYTPLNDFDKNSLKTIVGGQDAILGGINVINGNEVQIKAYLVEGEKAEVGDMILIAGNRKGIITAAVYADDNPDVVLTLTVVEQDIPQRNDATPEELTADGFIGQSTREVDYVFGIQTATGTESEKIAGGTTHNFILGAPTVIKKKTVDPATWNPIARAMADYAEQSETTVAVTLTVYSDEGITPAANGYQVKVSKAGQPGTTHVVAGGAGEIALSLVSNTNYSFTNSIDNPQTVTGVGLVYNTTEEAAQAISINATA